MNDDKDKRRKKLIRLILAEAAITIFAAALWLVRKILNK